MVPIKICIHCGMKDKGYCQSYWNFKWWNKNGQKLFWSNHTSALQGDVLNLRGQRSHSGNGRYFGGKMGTNLMSLLHCGWHVTSRTHQQTSDRSGREIQLSKKEGGERGLTICLLAWVVEDTDLLRHAQTRDKQLQIQTQLYKHKVDMLTYTEASMSYSSSTCMYNGKILSKTKHTAWAENRILARERWQLPASLVLISYLDLVTCNFPTILKFKGHF